MNNNPMLTVRLCRTSKAQVLLAFFFAHTSLTTKDLKEWTGLKDETIREACDELARQPFLLLGKETKARGEIVWHPAGDLLPLMNMELEPGDPALSAGEFQDSGKRSPGATTTTTWKGLLTTDEEVVVAVARTPQNGVLDFRNGNPDDIRRAKEEQQAEQDRQRRKQLDDQGIPVERNLKACKLYGIGEPTASQLSELKHVTPEFIEAHIRSLGPGETKGLAIVRIRADETPRNWAEEIDQENWHAERQARKQGMSLEEWRSASEADDEDD